MGSIPKGCAKARIAGTATPMTAMTEPRSMWTANERATMMAAMMNMLSGTLVGMKEAIHAFIPVSAPTCPIAMAAVKKTRTCMGTALQSLAALRSPMMGMLMSMPTAKVTHPISMPWMDSVNHRMMAMRTHTMVLTSTPLILPISASLPRMASLSIE